MRRHLPLIAVIWGPAIVLYAVIKGGSFPAFLCGVALVIAGAHELTKTKRRRNSTDNAN
jgi:hypothetical protein